MKKLIYAQQLPLNNDLLAKCIYGSFPHLTHNVGIFLGKPILEEMRLFLKSYSSFLGIKNFYGNYFRLDVFISENGISIIEVNTRWLDGFGTALNLSRVAGFPVFLDPAKIWFPNRWTTAKEEYIPEIELACNEIIKAGLNGDYGLIAYEEAKKTLRDSPVFVYGVEPDIEKVCYPENGWTFDSKINLAEFSRKWNGKSRDTSYVTIPIMYWNKQNVWNTLPENIVFKLINKFDLPEIRDELKRPVVFGKKDAYRKFYDRGFLVGQDIIPGLQTVGVIMCVGTEPVAGYTQFMPVSPASGIVNDNGSFKGPLIFES